MLCLDSKYLSVSWLQNSLVFCCRPEPFLCLSFQGPVRHELHICGVGLESSSSLSNVEQDARDSCEAIGLQNPVSLSCFYSEYFTVLSLIPNLTVLKKNDVLLSSLSKAFHLVFVEITVLFLLTLFFIGILSVDTPCWLAYGCRH